MRSGWCPPNQPHPRGHAACQQRQAAGLLDRCTCTQHGGHAVVTVPTPVTEPKKEDAA